MTLSSELKSLDFHVVRGNKPVIDRHLDAAEQD